MRFLVSHVGRSNWFQRVKIDHRAESSEASGQMCDSNGARQEFTTPGAPRQPRGFLERTDSHR